MKNEVRQIPRPLNEQLKSKILYRVLLAIMMLLIAAITLGFFMIQILPAAISIHILLPLGTYKLYKIAKNKGISLKVRDAYIAGLIAMVVSWIPILWIGDFFDDGWAGSFTQLSIIISIIYAIVSSSISALTIAACKKSGKE